jgi:hypothetical protein
MPPTVFVVATGVSKLRDGEFLHWLSAIVKPYDGYVHETGYADPPGPNSMRPRDH